MKEKFRNYREFVSDYKAGNQGNALRRLYNWSDPAVFTSDVKRMMEQATRIRAERPNNDSFDRSVHYSAQSGAAAAKVRAPVHLPGVSISGAHAQKKVRANLPDMERAFRAKMDKGRAGTVMMLNFSSGRGGGRYYFVLATSDGAAQPRRNLGDGWEPAGDHEVVVWTWASSQDQRRHEDMASLF